MKKFKVVITISLVLALLFTGCAQNNTEPQTGSNVGVNKTNQSNDGPIVIKWGNVFSTDMPFNQGVEKAIELVEEKSNGDIEIQFFPSSQLGSNTEMMAMLSGGTTQMGNEGGGFLSQWAPKFLVSEAVYAFRDIDHMFSVMNGEPGQEMFGELLEERGVRVIDVWYYGTRHITAKKPIYTPDDLKGLKMRVPDGELYISNGKALGATPTPMTLSEVYLSLNTNVIDSQENPLTAIYSNKFYEVQDYVSLTGHNYNFNTVMVNDDFWQSLSQEHRDIITESIKEAGEYQLEIALDEEAKLVEQLEVEGVTFIEPDTEQFREEAGKYMISEYEDVWGKGYYESIQSYE